MKTPFKLKRDGLSSLSTIERTIPMSSKYSLAQKTTIAPEAPANDRQLLQKYECPPSQPIIPSSIKADTAEFEKQMARIMR
jgi:hypothetical protein